MFSPDCFESSIPQSYFKTEISGLTFNKLANGRKFFKLINEQMKHHGLKYEPNKLHTDPIYFTPFGECNPGGIYFCDESIMYRWYKYNDYLMYYYAEVKIPDDAKVYIEYHKVKTDKLYLGEFNKYWDNENIVSKIVDMDGLLLRYINKQTHDICMIAVKNNGMALKFVKHQSHDICLAAVKDDGHALKYVINKTHKIYLTAVKNNGMML
jgi:hypothetical protein